MRSPETCANQRTLSHLAGAIIESTNASLLQYGQQPGVYDTTVEGFEYSYDAGFFGRAFSSHEKNDQRLY